MKLDINRVLPGLALLLLVMGFLFPLLKDGVAVGHDSGYHLTRVQMMAQALKEGQFPVRWVEGPVRGLSHPLFSFYPPFLYYLAGGLNTLGVEFGLSIYLVIWVIVGVGVGGAYRLAREWGGKGVSIVASAGWCFLPYHISQMYVRAAYPELLATSLMPWVYLLSYRVWKGKGGGELIALGGGIAAVMVSHQPTFIMHAFLLLLWNLFWWVKTQRNEGWRRVLVSGLIAMGLAAWFVVPMIMERENIRPELLRSGYFDFRDHFATFGQVIWSKWGYGLSLRGESDGMAFQLGVVGWMVAIGGTWLAIRKKADEVIAMGLILIGMGLFMAMDISLIIWERLLILGYIQYPWRWLQLAGIGVVLIIAGCGDKLVTFIAEAGSATKSERKIIEGVIAGVGVMITVVVVGGYLKPAAYLPKDRFDLRKDIRQEFGKSSLFGVEEGYLPKGVEVVDTTPDLPIGFVRRGKGVIIEGYRGVKEQRMEVVAETELTLAVTTHNYLGFKVKVNGSEVNVASEEKTGYMLVEIKEGKNEVVVRLEKTEWQQVGETVTMVTIGGIVGSIAWGKWKKRKPRN